MSKLSQLFTPYTTTTIDAHLGKLLADRSERTAEAEAAESKVAAEIIEAGTSPSAKLAESLRRDVAGIDRAIADLEQERSVVAKYEEEIRVAKVWRAANDLGRNLANRVGVLEGRIIQDRTEAEQLIADYAKLKAMVPKLPEGFEHAEPLEAGFLAAIRDQFHGANFRDHARRPSPAAWYNDKVALALYEKPDELHSGTQRLLKPSPSHDASAKP